nr:glycosyltransferase [uncultured Niameybacter sp.]
MIKISTKILIISFGVKEFDGRLKELRDVISRIGNYKIVCCSRSAGCNEEEYIVNIKDRKYLDIRNYIYFICMCLKVAKDMKKIDVLVVDNMFATIPALIIRKLINPNVIIQDVRELYFYNEIKKGWARFINKCETSLIRKSQIVLVANRQRAEIMKKYYNLNKMPIVFENIRFLTGEYDGAELNKKYEGMFKYKTNIISTGGLSVSRETHKLVDSMKYLTKDYGLFLLGDGSDEDKRLIHQIISDNNLENIHFLGKVSMSELRYIVKQCDIGMVHYHKNDLNNKYCASGKIYEYLAEGLPVVTTENITLKELCKDNNIGVADDKFYEGILKVSEDIEFYKNNVRKFISSVSVEDYNQSISNEILRLIEEA